MQGYLSKYNNERKNIKQNIGDRPPFDVNRKHPEGCEQRDTRQQCSRVWVGQKPHCSAMG